MDDDGWRWMTSSDGGGEIYYAETMYSCYFLRTRAELLFHGCLWNACDDDVKLKHDRHPTPTDITDTENKARIFQSSDVGTYDWRSSDKTSLG